MAMESEFKYAFYIKMVGDLGVGKSNLFSRYFRNEFIPKSKTTTERQVDRKIIQVSSVNIRVYIWDEAGYNAYSSNTTSRSVVGILLVYDITNRLSFENAQQFLNERLKRPNITVVLVGNKSDLSHSRAVPTEEAKSFAKMNNISFIETSTLDNTNVQEAFDLTWKKYVLKMLSPDLPREIQDRGTDFVKEYEKACKEGSQKIKFFRLMIVGPEGVGKTSLLRALRDQPFQEEENTTDFIEKTDITITELSHDWGEKVNFREKLEETRDDIIAQITMQSFIALQTSVISENVSTGSTPLQHVADKISDIPPGLHQLSTKSTLDSNQDSEEKVKVTSKPDIPLNMMQSVKEHWNIVKEHWKKEDERPAIEFFTVWDLAGQSYFFCMHSLFLSPRAVYLMPVDLSVDLTDKVDPRERKEGRVDFREIKGKTHLEVIQYWIRTICSVARSTVDKLSECKSRIIIVFTKSDKVPNPDAKAKNNFQLIKNSFARKSICWYIVDNEYHVISAKKRIVQNIDLLKRSIQRNADEISYDSALPMRWLEFSLKILSQPSPVIGEKEITTIANEANCMKETENILQLFHSIGVFFFRSNLVVKSLTKLLNIIFLIVSPRSYLDLIANCKKKQKKLYQDFEKTETEALITEDLLDLILLDNDLTEVKTEVTQLLEEFGVILTRHGDRKYYIPYLLKGDLSTIYQPESTDLISYIYFPDDQVPTSFYFALVSLCLRRVTLSSSKLPLFSFKLNIRKLVKNDPKLAFDCLRFQWKSNIYCVIDFTKHQPYIRIIFQGMNYYDEETYSEISALLFLIQNWIVHIQKELILAGNHANIVLKCPCNSFEENLVPCAYFETFLEQQSSDETHFYCKVQQKHYSWFYTKLNPFKYIPSALGQAFINENRENLAQELDIDTIFLKLFEEGLINKKELSKMYSLENTKKMTILLEIIPYKGKKWAQRFYKVLKSKSAKNREITSLFEAFIIKSLISDEPVGETLEFSRYPILHNPCGICLIINMEEFDYQKQDRKGSNVDFLNLTETFENMNFIVQPHKNLDISQLEKVLDETRNLNYSEFDVFFCILMSHGHENETILTSDMEEVNKNTIWNRFNSDNCPTLATKPKVFIIQACRGKKHDLGNEVLLKKDDPPETQEKSTLLDTDTNPGPSPKHNILQSQVTSEKVATHADFYIAQATVRGYVSYRDPIEGSTFINAFCSVLKSSSYHHHFVDMMTEVRSKVSKADLGGRIQCPEATDRLQKQLYLL